jgi:hypothetical protein
LIHRLIKQFVPEGVPVGEALRAWYRQSGHWYTTSFLVHAIGFVLLAIIFTLLPNVFPGVFGPSQPNETLSLDPASQEGAVELDTVPRFEVGDASYEYTKLDRDTLLAGPQAPQKALYIDDSDTFVAPGGGRPSELEGPKLGGLGGFSVPRKGPAGLGGVGVSDGTGDTPGAGDGRGEGLGGRGQGSRKALTGVSGGTIASDRAVAGGLNWLARHQSPAGNWSLQHTPARRPWHSWPSKAPARRTRTTVRTNRGSRRRFPGSSSTRTRGPAIFRPAHRSRCTRTGWRPSLCARPTP